MFFIFFSTKPMVNKHDRLVAYDQNPLIIKTYNPSITWSYEVRWQIETYFPFHQVYCHQTIQGDDSENGSTIPRSYDPLIMSDSVANGKCYIHFFEASGYQTWERSRFDARGFYPQSHNEPLVIWNYLQI